MTIRATLMTTASQLFVFCNSFLDFRTPRVHLSMKVTPRVLGDLLCKYMHDEDNKFGIRVTNVRGDKWIAYGDGMLMKECSKVYPIYCSVLIIMPCNISCRFFWCSFLCGNKRGDPTSYVICEEYL